MIDEFYEAILVSYQAYYRVTKNRPSIFVCSPQLRKELGETVLGLFIEVDDTLYGYNDYYWL